ncbi:MAG: tetratricopeptide repeat protein [Anaerolineae bacterium]|nr:tetratricopeptide repeat protein [Anaerolineae bacterium]
MVDYIWVWGLTGLIVLAGVLGRAVARRARTARLLRRAQRSIAVGEQQAALAMLTRAIELDDSLALAYALRSQVLVRAGVVDRALDDAGEAVRLAPTSHHSRLARARLYDYLGRYEDAAAELVIALEHHAAWVTGYLELARCYLLLGEPACAVATLERLAARVGARDPLRYDALVMVGSVYEQRLRDFDAAVEAYTRAIVAAPNRRVGYLRRGWALRARGEYQLAAEDLLSAAQRPLWPDDLRLHYWLQSQTGTWSEGEREAFERRREPWIAVLERMLFDESEDLPDPEPDRLVAPAAPQIYLN